MEYSCEWYTIRPFKRWHHGKTRLSQMLLTRQTRPGKNLSECTVPLEWAMKMCPFRSRTATETYSLVSIIDLESVKSDRHHNRSLALQYHLDLQLRTIISWVRNLLWARSCPFDKFRHLVASCRTRRPLSNANRSPRCGAPLPEADRCRKCGILLHHV